MAKNNVREKAAAQVPAVHKKEGQMKQVFKRLAKNRTAMVGLTVLILIVLASVFAGVISPYDPNAFSPKEAFSGSSMQHLLGCDRYGRDMLTRLLYGGRYSLALGLLAAAASAVIGLILGTLAGYFGGWVDNLIMRFLDVLQAIPGMLLSICIATALGNGFVNTIIALSIGGVAGITRMLRARILSERKCEYLEAASSINCSTTRIMFKHLLPNCISVVIISTALQIPNAIFTESFLSFLGLGVNAPMPSLGSLASDALNGITSYSYRLIFPALVICLIVLSLNLFGDGLRDAFDPKLKS